MPSVGWVVMMEGAERIEALIWHVLSISINVVVATILWRVLTLLLKTWWEVLRLNGRRKY